MFSRNWQMPQSLPGSILFPKSSKRLCLIYALCITLSDGKNQDSIPTGSFNMIHKLTRIVHFEIENFRWADLPSILEEKLELRSPPSRKLLSGTLSSIPLGNNVPKDQQQVDRNGDYQDQTEEQHDQPLPRCTEYASESFKGWETHRQCDYESDNNSNKRPYDSNSLLSID
jgi:hypothetical protein